MVEKPKGESSAETEVSDILADQVRRLCLARSSQELTEVITRLGDKAVAVLDVIAQSIEVATGVDGEASVGVGEEGISEN